MAYRDSGSAWAAGANLRRARPDNRPSRLSEVLLQLALAEQQCRNDTGALAEALDIGRAEGYVRTFLDEGRELRAMIERWLLECSIANRPAVSLARQQVAMGGGSSRRKAGSIDRVTFNKRERQILSLLKDGPSNAQLAKRCCISEGTVKWYLHKLYEKLGVANRTALLGVVRDSGLTI